MGDFYYDLYKATREDRVRLAFQRGYLAQWVATLTNQTFDEVMDKVKAAQKESDERSAA